MNPRLFHNGKVQLYAGNCMEVLSRLSDDSIDAVVTDPPYHLTSITQRFSKNGYSKSNLEQPADKNLDGIMAGSFRRLAKGFMGKVWDGGDIAFRPELWAEVLRVLKPGGHMVCFGGTRTYHRMTCAIEDAGFEIRDAIMWHYGSGFPKSHDVSKGIDRMGGQPWAEFATLLASLISRAGFNYTTLDQALGIPSAGSNSCCWVRSDERGGLPPRHYYEKLKTLLSPPVEFTDLYDKAEREVIAEDKRKNAPSGIVGAGRPSIEVKRLITAPATDAARQWQGYGTALKPSTEIICLARKPLSESTVAANVLRWGTGALNIDKCRVGIEPEDLAATSRNGEYGPTTPGSVGFTKTAMRTPINTAGRWPANLCHDGSPEVLAGFPDAVGAVSNGRSGAPNLSYSSALGVQPQAPGYADSGSAARFFASFPQDETAKRFHYTSKADKDDRLNSRHPTVKPVDLMQWLVRLVCPKGATVLDPFAGTGTTGAAAFIEGRRAVLIEREAEYLADIERRMELLLSGPDERSWKLAKPESLEALPLFALTKPAA